MSLCKQVCLLNLAKLKCKLPQQCCWCYISQAYHLLSNRKWFTCWLITCHKRFSCQIWSVPFEQYDVNAFLLTCDTVDKLRDLVSFCMNFRSTALRKFVTSYEVYDFLVGSQMTTLMLKCYGVNINSIQTGCRYCWRAATKQIWWLVWLFTAKYIASKKENIWTRTLKLVPNARLAIHCHLRGHGCL